MASNQQRSHESQKTTTTTRILVTDPRNDTITSVGPTKNSKKVSTTYSVSTPNSSVRRKYSDFQWLQLRLGQEYPGAIVPIIPHQRPIPNLMIVNNGGGPNRFDPDFIEQRRQQLQKFIQRIINHPEFYNSNTYWKSSINNDTTSNNNDLSALRVFLTIPLGDDFEFAKKLSESTYCDNMTSNIIPIVASSTSVSSSDQTTGDKNGSETAAATEPTATAVTMEDDIVKIKPTSKASKMGRGISKFFNKAMTTMHVTAGNVELVETSSEQQITAITCYVNQIEGHVSQLLKNVQSIVKLTGDQATQFHELGVPIAMWRTTDQNNTFASAAIAAAAASSTVENDIKNKDEGNDAEKKDDEDGNDTKTDDSGEEKNNNDKEAEKSIMSTMTGMVQFSTEYSEILDKKFGEEKMKFVDAIESISLDLKSFQVALKQRHDIRVLCTSKIKKVADKQSQINKARGKDPETVAKQISKLESELKDQRQKADISKKLLDDCTQRIIRETDRTKLQYEYALKECFRSFAKLQIQYNEKLNDEWTKLLPHLE